VCSLHIFACVVSFAHLFAVVMIAWCARGQEWYGKRRKDLMSNIVAVLLTECLVILARARTVSNCEDGIIPNEKE
jgi:hypothetical protein